MKIARLPDMIKIILLHFVLFAYPNYAEQPSKYFIFFTDKGEGASLQKLQSKLSEAKSLLSDASIARREKSGIKEIVTYEDIPVERSYIAAVEQTGIEIVHRLDWFNAVSAYLDSRQIEIVRNLPFVSRIVRVKKLPLIGKPEEELTIPSSPAGTGSARYGQSYTQLALSDVVRVHAAGITGTGIKVGLLDTGFDWQRHEALKTRNVIGEKDFIFNDNITANEAADAASQHNHGTYVFGIIGAYKDSVMIGAAYDASFILAKTEDVRSEKHIEEDNYAAALQWMENAGVDITSSSLGYNTFDAGETSYTYADMDGKTTIVTRAAELAFSKGVLTLTAAGNEGNGSWFHILAPADGINTIAVGAVSSDDSVASFSSRGPTSDGRIKPDVVTQGVFVYGTRASTENEYYFNNGTSAATPIASGIAALVLSAHPHLTNVQLRNILRQTANNFSSPNNFRGYGLLSAVRAIEYPTIEQQGFSFILHKVIADSIDRNALVYAHFFADNKRDSVIMSQSGAKYKVTIPVYGTDQLVKLRFSYYDENGGYRLYPAKSYLSCYYGSTSVLTSTASNVPFGFAINQNYPNPFKSGTTVSFNAAFKDDALIEVFNVLGEKVRLLYSGVINSGLNEFIWDGKDDHGQKVASGVYMVTVKIGTDIQSSKMLLLR